MDYYNNTEFHQYKIQHIDFDGIDRFSYITELDGPRITDPVLQVENIQRYQGSFKLAIDNHVYSLRLVYQKPSLLLSCSCTEMFGICLHQRTLLISLFRNEEWLTFFSDKRYDTRLRKAGVRYGLTEEAEIEKYLKLGYQDKLEVSLQNNSIISLDHNYFKIKKNDTDSKNMPLQDTIIVIKRHRFYKHLQIQLCLAQKTKQGKLKNPIHPIPVLDSIWKSKDVFESQFYSAIQQLSQSTNELTDEQLQRALSAVVKNPLGLAVYMHNDAHPASLTSTQLTPVFLKSLAAVPAMEIRTRESFMTLHASLSIENKSYSLHELTLKLTHFILINHTLYHIPLIEIAELIALFHDKGKELLIHQSIFKTFNTKFLESLSQSIEIRYPDMPKISKRELAHQKYYGDREAIIYLDESQDYITLTPVFRYADIEVPIRSQRQIVGMDPTGNSYLVKRCNDKEQAVIALLIKQHPYFEEQLQESFLYFYLHRKHFLNENWFLNVFEEWRNHGISIIGFNFIKNNNISPFKGKVTVEVKSGINWFNVNINLNFGIRKAAIKKLEKAVRNRSKFITLDDGTVGILPEEWIEKFATYFEAGEIDDRGNILVSKNNFSTIDHLFEEHQLDKKTKEEIQLLKYKTQNFKNINKLKPPKTFNGTLRPYQHEGLNWLNFLDDFRLGGCLADDMGLGKTIQIIAFILSQREKKESNCNLLVLPTTLIFNWKRELQQFAPDIDVLILDGPKRRKSAEAFKNYELIMISYHNLLTDINYLKKYTFNYIFLDESQQIKNPNSQRYKAALLLQSYNRIALTGTPIENNTLDLYAQLSFACPGLLGSKKYFKDVYTTPIDAFSDRKRMKSLQQKIQPFILRRTKQEVMHELPEKNEIILYCDMKPDQRKIYDLYEKEFREFISVSDGDEIRKNAMYVLKGLTKLRLICNSTKLLKTEDLTSAVDSAKIETLVEQIADRKDQQKIVVFSQFVSMLELVKKALEKVGIEVAVLTGKSKNREKIVHGFQEQEDTRVILVSLKVGGMGLNLTAANLVYLIDPWWNPAVEEQAIDRTYRIGQDKAVTAIRLITPDTVEEKMIKLQQQKKEIASTLIGNGTNPLFADFSKDDLLRLLS